MICWRSSGLFDRLFKKAVQRGRSERRGEAYSFRYVEPLSDAIARCSLRATGPRPVDFFNSLLMASEALERHQVAGLDSRERGFSRPVEIERTESGFRAQLRYEATRVVTEDREAPVTALEELIRMLQAQGYSQLRSQLSFKDGTYLGSREQWIEYPDPARESPQAVGLLGRLLGWLR